MINYLRTITARFVVRYLSGPRSLLVAAWGLPDAPPDRCGRFNGLLS